jgi:putative hydrolase of the HAD superfamily
MSGLLEGGVRAITLDLDDTLWPIWPVIERAEQVLLDWLRVHAGATAAAHDRASLRAIREAMVAELPHLAHDLSALRLESIRRALVAAGDSPELAERAFEVFFEARQRVELYEDALPALERLARRVPIVALTNGNADLVRTGIAPHFAGCVTARTFGAAKPERAIFHEACRVAGHAPAEVLHVGDDLRSDVAGALDAGLRAAWVRRDERHALEPGARAPHHVVAHLLALADLLGA